MKILADNLVKDRLTSQFRKFASRFCVELNLIWRGAQPTRSPIGGVCSAHDKPWVQNPVLLSIERAKDLGIVRPFR